MAQGLGSIAQHLHPAVIKYLQDFKESLEVAARQRGDPMKSYVTLGELVGLDLAKVIRVAPGGGIIVQPPGPPNLIAPPAPTGFIVTDGFAHVFTEWSSPYEAYGNHARTRIYRATTDNLAAATEIGQSTGFAFADMNVVTGTIYYYWCRWESTSGVLGPYNDTAGTPGQRSEDPGEILDLLVGQITETHLYAALQDRIDLIDAPDTGLIDLLEAETAARLAAILELLDQLEDAEDRILAAETDITALEVDVDDLETGVAAQGTAISLLTTRVTAAEGTITSHGTSLTTLAAALEDAEDGISGNASAISALDARVVITEDSIESQSSSIIALENSVEDLEGDVSGHTTAISSLTTGLTAAQGTITAHSSQLTSLTAAVEDAQDAADAAAAAATALDARVDIAEGTISSHSSQLTTLSSDVEDAEDAIAANASAIASLDTRVDATESSITTISASIIYLTAAVEDGTTGLVATSTAVSLLEARVEDTEEGIEAQAEAVTQVNARLDDFGGTGVTVEEKFTATASDVEGLFGQYTLKIDANGHVAGFGLSIESVNGGPLTSYFIVNANRFAIVSSTVTRKVAGQSVTSGVLTVTTDSAHNYAAGNDVMFSSMEEEEWKSQVLSVIDAPSSTTFRVSVPGGHATPLTAAIKANFRPVTSLTRSGTVATAVFPGAHNLVVGSKIDISNADQAEWNAQFIVTAVSGANVSFTVTTDFTTPATASVKVARVTVPFVVADNRVVMDGAFIKEATITSAMIQTLSVEKITGLNATFIQANINEIDAFEIDVINLTAENINGDLQRIQSISDGQGLPGVTTANAVFRSWIEPPIGGSGHRIAVQLSGYYERVSVGSSDTDTVVQMFVRAIPSSIAGAPSHAAGYVLTYEATAGSGGVEILRAPTAAIGVIDLQGGDILVRDSNSAKWIVKEIQTGIILGTNYVFIYAHSHDPDALFSGSNNYTVYRPAATDFGTTICPTSGNLFAPFTALAASPGRYTTGVTIELLALQLDSDGDPVGTGLGSSKYIHKSTTGLVYGLR